jgi:hypothetical protein
LRQSKWWRIPAGFQTLLQARDDPQEGEGFLDLLRRFAANDGRCAVPKSWGQGRRLYACALPRLNPFILPRWQVFNEKPPNTQLVGVYQSLM